MTKLNADQKADRKAMKKQFKAKGGMLFAFGRVTIAIMPTCRGKANISWAIAAKDEPKIRRKVGEYHALCRWYDGHEMPVECAQYQFIDLSNKGVFVINYETMANDFALQIAGSYYDTVFAQPC